ncbi:malto-oligosyltrehalose trehalohydrolase [Chitinophaga parva]|uniref:Malto-oligosyltrehalose trehalohydrolase n=1 Tax=Chitinophaga parva TaxID=2169414 RepID=A0A2T7BDV7_9BACT|nr:malto-oligosyltrehalose trehalohydrolase [Chitinophaga parva]PUZ23210.1 malto-oligosyltrehalose trehalohydrolase [Chitinophaga parva]
MAHYYTPVGAHLGPDQICTFTVWAPFRKAVSLVVIAPLPAEYPMARDENGYWHYRMAATPTGLQYLYKLDNDLLRPDPASRYQPGGVHGPSAVVQPAYPHWTDDDWRGLELKDLVLYELHTGTFSPQRNFQGIIARLSYLEKLGVNAIEIMPVAQFSGTRNWGYDGVYPFAVQHNYGSVNGLKEVVNAAHKHGIAVILDVVYNHLGPEGNYFADFGPYFTSKYKTPWADAVNFDDAYCDAVRDYFLQNALMWLDEFHIDGLRLDAVHAIWDCSARHFVAELSEAVSVLERRLGRRKLLIAEIDYNAPRYIDPVEQGGYGLAGQWVDEFHHALHTMLTGELDGYYEDFNGIAHLAKAYKDNYVYTGQYSPHRKRRFGDLPRNHHYSDFIVFSQNHDQVGNRLLGDRLSATLDLPALKLAAAAYLLAPQTPMIFMGEEYGETKPFQFFTSHGDAELIAALREGRRREFASFNWQGAVPDPQSENTFYGSALSWEPNEALLECYRSLIALRRNTPALQNQGPGCIAVEILNEKALLLQRKLEEKPALFIYLNFSKDAINVTNVNGYTLNAVFTTHTQPLPAEIAVHAGFQLPAMSASVFAVKE